MGEILGLGMTHYPPLTGLDENMAAILRRVQQDPGLPARLRDPASWPAPMRAEYGADGGTASAACDTSTPTTVPPSRAMIIAVAFPMPAPAAEISATLPSNLMSSLRVHWGS